MSTPPNQRVYPVIHQSHESVRTASRIAFDSIYDLQDALKQLLTQNQGGAVGFATVAAGAVTAVQVTYGGFNYTEPPTVGFTGGGGTGATAVAILSGNRVTGVTITNGGAGYATAPQVTFTP